MGLPSRHLTFIVQFDAPLELVMDARSAATAQRFDALLSGFHTEPAVIRHDGNQHGVQLHLTPAGRAGAVRASRPARSPPTPCRSTRCGARRRASSSSGSASATTWPARFAVLDRVLLRAAAGPRRGAVRRARRRRRGVAPARRDGRPHRRRARSPARSAGAAATSPSSSPPSSAFGPKEMARVLRFERSKRLFVRPATRRWPTIAAECGYADQAHMAREWRALAGASPTQWLAAEQLPVAATPSPSTSRRAERRRRPGQAAGSSRRRMLPARNFSITASLNPSRLVVKRPSGSRPPSMCG